MVRSAWWLGWLCLVAAVFAQASNPGSPGVPTPGAPATARLETADTAVVLEAGASAPRLVQVEARGKTWQNRAEARLIEAAYEGEREMPLQWRFLAGESRADSKSVTFVYESESPRLRLKWEWRARAAFGPLEHSIEIENRDGRELWLPLQESLRFDFQVGAAALEQVYVEKGAGKPSDVGTHREAVGEGYRWRGTSSTYAHPEEGEPREIIPWMLVEEPGGEQRGWYAGIEFSGRTQLSLERAGGRLRGSVGLNPEPGPFRTRLRPGESFAAPTVFVGGASGGPDGAGNVLRRWVREVLGNPGTWSDPRYPLVTVNSWGGGMKVDETIAGRMIRDASKLGVEMFHVDAGWFRAVGDWHPDTKKFPHGLAAIAKEAHKRGMKFGLWADWAQAGVSTERGALSVNDPQVRGWLLTDVPPDWKPEEFKGQTIDLGVPEAKEWAQRETERIVRDYGLDMLEHDGYLVAQGCEHKDHPHAPPDAAKTRLRQDMGWEWVESSNSTDVSYHATRAYYEIQGKLREEHPGMLLEVCNDGGRMVDFGSAAHADYFSMTDAYDPVSNRRAFYDASHVLPPAMLESYVEKWPAPRVENFRSMLRSGMMGWLTLMQDTSAWTREQHAAAKEELKLYKKELRPLLRDAELYHVTERPDGVRWDGMEYFDPAKQKGVLYAFRGTTDKGAHVFRWRGLQAEQKYRVRFRDRSAPKRVLSGRELMEAGVEVRLPLPNSSELVFVEAVK